ncbi:HU family DNA-binding protein [Methylobacterium sp. E-045]|uniref:HU family DNA-binding protein n=1 Tax=Methylobacterium sp. E-045 TaxID=2836575 RepID=UPI001FBAB884|nr:HU family DNA-binding protein [Methylobacterium sp. E-045]MCJ2131586.1 HU family DNA-binding protein [Methylobacterium sp. E-045]
MTTKNELAAAVSAQAGLTKAQAAAAVDALVDHINIEVRNGRDLTVAGLGVFKRKQREARSGRNPSTGEAIQIASKRIVQFKPAKAFSDAVA